MQAFDARRLKASVMCMCVCVCVTAGMFVRNRKRLMQEVESLGDACRMAKVCICMLLVCMFTRVFGHAYIRIYVQYVCSHAYYACTYICIQTYTYIHMHKLLSCKVDLYACMIYIYIYIYTHTHT